VSGSITVEPGAVRRRTWGNRAGTVETDGTIRMDLRFTAFELITRDAVLRKLLVNHADRLEHGPAPDGRGTDACFLALQWSADDRPGRPAGSQLLTARVHMPRRHASEHSFLDFVLARLRAALTVTPANGLITTRCLSESGKDEDADTVSRACTFEVVPALSVRDGAALLGLAPWTGCVHLGSASFIAVGDTVPSMN
jgi:hypothetical protein